jgi:hypothetical protein
MGSTPSGVGKFGLSGNISKLAERARALMGENDPDAMREPVECEDGKGAVSEQLAGKDAAIKVQGYPKPKRDRLLPAVMLAATALLTVALWAVPVWIALTVL